MQAQALNLQQKLKLINDVWSPRVIAEMNDYQFKLAKVKGVLAGTIIRIPMKLSSYWKAACVSIFAMAMWSSMQVKCTLLRQVWNIDPRLKTRSACC